MNKVSESKYERVMNELKAHQVIESNVEDEFVKWLDLVILFNDRNIFGNPNDDLQTRLLKQVKEKYLEIKKKNT